MLREIPQRRPTIYDVLRETCLIQGKEVPIRDVGDICLLCFLAKAIISSCHRSMPSALNQRSVDTRSFLRLPLKRPRWAQYFRLRFRKLKLSRILPPCGEGDQHGQAHSTIRRNRAHRLSELSRPTPSRLLMVESHHRLKLQMSSLLDFQLLTNSPFFTKKGASLISNPPSLRQSRMRRRMLMTYHKGLRMLWQTTLSRNPLLL
jgi:hypothetical protein